MFNPRFPSLPADAAAGRAESPELGALPEWDLSHLYPGATSPEFAGDFDDAARKARAFSERWKGHLADAAEKSGDDGLGAATETYEAIGDTLGR
ncbi:MAG: oligoendopeptidase F, partial [Martelella sp.]